MSSRSRKGSVGWQRRAAQRVAGMFAQQPPPDCDETVAVNADLRAIAEDAEKVVLFDRHRLVIQSLGDELATATPEAILPIVALLVERIKTADRQVVGWLQTGPAEPLVDSALLSPWRPRTVPGTQEGRSPLAWYLEVG